MRFTHLVAAAALLAASAANAQQSVKQPYMSWDYLEFRFLDVDVAGGDGLRFGGSYRFQNNWLLVGSLTDVDYDRNIDTTTVEIGTSYVWPYRDGWDLYGDVRLVDISGDADETGAIFRGGIRGLLTPEFEIRGTAVHVTTFDSDTYLEFGGDFYFSDRFSAGLTFEFAGDVDIWTVGARWYFR